MPSSLLQLQVTTDHPVPISPGGGTATVTVQSGSTVYYSSSSQVSAGSNEGSISASGSQAFTNQTWLKSAGSSTVQVETTPYSTATAAAFTAAGLTGTTAASRYVGATASGAPVSGTFSVGDFVIDQTGAMWVCVTAGSPGTWLPGSSGVELAETDLTANVTLNQTAQTDVAGLSITFTAPARSFVVTLMVPNIGVGNGTQYCAFYITDSANTVITLGTTGPSSSTVAQALFLQGHLPRTGTGAYSITPGNSYTFKARYAMSSVAGGSGTIFMNSGTSRPILRAVTC